MELPGSYNEQKRLSRFGSIQSNKSYGSEIISELLPLKNSMKYQLSRRGIRTKNVPFRDVVSLYYNEFVSNQYDKTNSYDPVNTHEFRNHAAFNIKLNDFPNGDLKSFRNYEYFSKIYTVTDGIVKKFKAAHDKKQLAFSSNYDTDSPVIDMTKDEKIQADAIDKVQKNIEAEAYLSKPITRKQVQSLVFIGALIVVIYYLCGN
jgi:hypothetical protein